MVPVHEVQQALVQVFRRWGPPTYMRVDNGLPLGEPYGDAASPHDTIPPLALWLIGKGIGMIWNRPAQPRDNAKVERMQRLSEAWAEAHTCRSCEELSARLGRALWWQRCRYPVRRLGMRTRAQVYPELETNARVDAEGVDMARVWSHLAQGTWVRKVSRQGQIEFFTQRWSVGRRYHAQRVWLKLEGPEWVVRDEALREIARFDAGFMTEEVIEGLSLCGPHARARCV